MLEKFLNLARSWTLEGMLIRMFTTLLVGIIIGIDRGIKRRGAGIKTHTLVCLGAALVMMTGQYIQEHFVGTMDVARLGAQVISGVGFLGVGTIMVTGHNQVRGLTTAAGLWVCATLGLAAGIGFVEGAVIALILILVTLRVLARVDSWLHSQAKVFDLYIEFYSGKSISQFVQKVRAENVKISSMEIGKSKIKGEGPNAIVRIELANRNKRSVLIDTIREMEGVSFVEEL